MATMRVKENNLNTWSQYPTLDEKEFLDASSQIKIPIEEAKEAGAVVISYGVFFNTIISFIIVAFAVFVVIRNINKMKKEEEAPPAEPTTKECTYCFSTIPIKATKCPQCTSSLS